ncbi:unnamed protein product [Chilo suppressalis]|uniref:Mitochondrial cytochrome c oxidase subunit VIc/VIIs domain-containing protein n=1 Tax=Chilo suppressalis TaxID=168631 RepID=A0ABN8B2H2_CHISP|nr:hypothetical protein evm_004536 [Chilo suppressalis]CAH0403207.1 unnamed protein product [Chilo suppressalis]
MSCPPPTPNPCTPTCPPPAPAPPCRTKPIMRGLHMAQTKSVLIQAILLSFSAGALWYYFGALPRRAAYKDYYAKGEFEDWADEMARKGIFQSVPKGSSHDKKHDK